MASWTLVWGARQRKNMEETPYGEVPIGTVGVYREIFGASSQLLTSSGLALDRGPRLLKMQTLTPNRELTDLRTSRYVRKG